MAKYKRCVIILQIPLIFGTDLESLSFGNPGLLAALFANGERSRSIKHVGNSL